MIDSDTLFISEIASACGRRCACNWWMQVHGVRPCAAGWLSAFAIVTGCCNGVRMSTPTPARQVVQAFGDCEALAALYSNDVTWRLNHSLAPNIAGPHLGKAAVIGFNEAVFTKFYVPGSVSVEILDELGDEASSAVRFNFRATSRRGHPYAVEYVLFAKTLGGKVCEVIELLDTHASNEQHQGNTVGVPPSN